jgi:hypothetical protein
LAVSKLFEKMKGENEKAKQRQLAEKLNISETYLSELLRISALEEYICMRQANPSIGHHTSSCIWPKPKTQCKEKSNLMRCGELSIKE